MSSYQQRQREPQQAHAGRTALRRDQAPAPPLAEHTTGSAAELVTRLQRRLGNAATTALLGTTTGDTTQDLAAAIETHRGSGAPLPDRTRADFEEDFGIDLSEVRIHTGGTVEALTEAIRADAFTTGTDVFVRSSFSDPESDWGRPVLAHELAHVVQQAAGEVEAAHVESGVQVSDPADRFEQEAALYAQERTATTAPTLTGAARPLSPPGRRRAVSPAAVHALQRSAGNHATRPRLQRQAHDVASSLNPTALARAVGDLPPAPPGPYLLEELHAGEAPVRHGPYLPRELRGSEVPARDDPHLLEELHAGEAPVRHGPYLLEELHIGEALTRHPPKLLGPADPVETASAAIISALRDVTGEAAAAQAWDAVVKQVESPSRAPGKKGGLVPEGLYSDEVVGALKALTPPRDPARSDTDPAKEGLARRKEVLRRVFEFLLEARDAELRGDSGRPDLSAEWELLTDIHKYFYDPSLDYYRTVRTGLIAAFGGLADGSATALERALHYYRTRIVKGEFLDKKNVPMHEELAKRLNTATSHLADPSLYHLRDLGSLTIRFNVNRPTALSPHSFGWGVDLDAEVNPNTQLPVGFVEGVTGINPTVDVSGRRPEQGTTAAEMTRQAERVHMASDMLKSAFADEPGLANALLAVARRQGWPSAGAEELLAATFAALAEGSRVEWIYEPVERLYCEQPKPAGRGRGRLGPRPRGYAHERLARMVFPGDATESEVFFMTPIWNLEEIRPTVDFMIQMADTYQRTWIDRKGERTRPKAEARSPSLPQLAVHGFLSLPPEVIGALAGSDAGGLVWLGIMRGPTKDYMHFELPAPARPDKYPLDL